MKRMYQILIKYSIPCSIMGVSSVEQYITLRSYWNINGHNHAGFTDLFSGEGNAEQFLRSSMASGKIQRDATCMIIEVMVAE